MKTLEDFLFELAISPKLSSFFKVEPKQAMQEFGLNQEEADILLNNEKKPDLKEAIGDGGHCTLMIRLFKMPRNN